MSCFQRWHSLLDVDFYGFLINFIPEVIRTYNKPYFKSNDQWWLLLWKQSPMKDPVLVLSCILFSILFPNIAEDTLHVCLL